MRATGGFFFRQLCFVGTVVSPAFAILDIYKKKKRKKKKKVLWTAYTHEREGEWLLTKKEEVKKKEIAEKR